MSSEEYRLFADSDAVVQSANPLFHTSESISQAWDRLRNDPTKNELMSRLEQNHSLVEGTESHQTFINEQLSRCGLERTTDFGDPRWGPVNAAWRQLYQKELAAISATPLTDTAAPTTESSVTTANGLSDDQDALPKDPVFRSTGSTASLQSSSPVLLRSRL